MVADTGCTLVAAAAAVLLLSVPAAVAQDAIVSWITPSYGGVGGAVKLTIYGQYFASDLFNFGAGRENLGNLVWLTSDIQSYECDVFKEGCNTEQIQCYTRPMSEGLYTVSIAVNGLMVDSSRTCVYDKNKCTYWAQLASTPIITSLTPTTSEPGSLITASGTIFTTRYGSNVATSTNGIAAQILRVYSAGQGCELMDNAGTAGATPYGITLDYGGMGITGRLTCKTSGTYIGNHNTSFILSPPYGRSKPSMDTIRVFANGKLAMRQTYTRVTGVSPHRGSIAGGTTLTITGQYFDDTDSPVTVDISGVPCDVTKFNDSHIFCTTVPQGLSGESLFSGGRGLLHEMWNDPTVSGAPADVSNMATDSPFYVRSWLDQVAFSYPYSRFATRTSGYVLLQRDTSCALALVSVGGSASLYFSPLTGKQENKTLIATSEGSQVLSNRYILRAKVPYYLEILQMAYSSGNHLQLDMQIYDAPFTASMTANAVNEVQMVTVSIAAVPERQQVSFELWPQVYGASPINEQQTIKLPALAAGTFQLSVAGAKTGYLSATSTAIDISDALNDLPTVYPDVATVVSTKGARGGRTLTVTFGSKRGVWPLIEVQLSDGRAAAVTRTREGIPSGDSVMLEMEGIRSRPFSPNATIGEVTAAVWDLFSVQCAHSLTAPEANSTAFYTNFEGSGEDINLNPAYYEWWWGGVITESYTPFCGRKSFLNPGYLFYVSKAVPLAIYPKLCFAYLGYAGSFSYIRYSFFDGTIMQSAINWYQIPSFVSAASWKYMCVDLLALLKQAHPTGSYFQVTYMTINPMSFLFVDVVSITKKELVFNYQAVMDSRIVSPTGVLVQGVEVMLEQPYVYNIEMTPVGCSHVFGLFKVPGSAVLDMAATTDSYYNDEFSPTPNTDVSDPVTDFTATGSPDSHITPPSIPIQDKIANVTRLTAAFFPIGGTYDLTILNNTVRGIPGDASAEVLASMLQFGGAGSVNVIRWGSCRQYTWQVEFAMHGGDIPLMVANGRNLEGTSASVRVQPYVDGVLRVSPVLGDMLAVPELSPQVRVAVNGIQTRCTGNCSFTWSNSSTPILERVSPRSGSGSQRLTISGNGFGSDTNAILVFLGDTSCAVSSVTASLIECNANLTARGNYSITVQVISDGNSTGFLIYEHVAQLSAVMPASGGTAGGTVMTLVGVGFESTMTITVGDTTCVMIELTNESLATCIVQPTTMGSGSVDVSLIFSDRSSVYLRTGFEFTDSTGVAIVHSITPLLALVDGTTTATIVGTGFGVSSAMENAIMLDGKQPVEIANYSEEIIVIEFPKMPPGSYLLSILTAAGYADMRTNNITQVQYILEITDVCPSSASAFGGAKITVTGIGFSNIVSRNVVHFGSRDCAVTEASSTLLKCTIPESAEEYQIDNTGTRPGYGGGFNWQPSSVTCEVGDTVEWSWQAPPGMSGMGYRVEQVMVGGSSTPYPDGFSSGSVSTPTGSYRRRFTEEGIYYYWSGQIMQPASNLLASWGVINVVPKPDFAGRASVAVNGYAAVESFGVGKQRDVVNGSTPACVDEQCHLFGGGSSTVLLSTTCSPVVINIMPKNGTPFDGVRLSGSGFSAQDYKNLVTIGGQPCVVQANSSNSTSLVCHVNPNDSLEPGIILPIELTFDNIGAAIVQVDGFTLKPWISSISPNQGSVTGGQLVTIRGGGFKGILDVWFGQSQCVVDVSLSLYSSVVCRTTLAPESIAIASITVKNSRGALVPAVRLCSDGCQYTFSLALKPTLAAVTPTEVQNSSTNLVITGSGFWNSSATVWVGSQNCSDVVVVSHTTITCTVGPVPAGDVAITVTFDSLGVADGTLSVSSPNVIYSVIPKVGSTNGGTTIIISGNGFGYPSTTRVFIGGTSCNITDVQPNVVTCVTARHDAANNVLIQVQSGGFEYPIEYFSYLISATPTITNLSPSSGISGTVVTLTGTQLSADSVVLFGETKCTVSAAQSTKSQITCTAGTAPSGIYPSTVLVPGLGFASIAPAALRFTYAMEINDVQPTQGSYAGGQEITLTGSGFNVNTTIVTICGATCQQTVVTSTTYRCLTPANTGTSESTLCLMSASSNELTVNASTDYAYRSSLTAQITGVHPKMGGTAGGTTITISGTGFLPTDGGKVTVKIAGVVCEQTTLRTDTTIICMTGAHLGTVLAPVDVYVNENGKAQLNDAGTADFWYVDRWSSIFTWGGELPPVEGDLVVIPPLMTVLLDTDTPVLKMLVIQGKLMFDEKNIELQAENILITDGGQLQVGTEEKPFQHKAIITLWGHLRSPELPVFGAKTLGVRNGTLDLHGQPRITWTVLASTANAGDSSINLTVPVDWQVGDSIVIATTGDHVSQFQNEEHLIAAVSDDQMTITLARPLRFTHIGETIRYCNGEVLEMRAEVGLLTRNVVVRGSVNLQWSETVPACEAGFDPGEFATQTCFLGRFGEDIGSDGFGASIMMAAPMMDQHIVTHRLSYVEISHAGQQYRLGRYPIHLHMNGDMSDSYVRGCSIHHTFNRAMNIHNTHNTLFEYNVIYHIEGGAVFLEDGIEYGNVLQYNLAVHVIPSSALLNDDVTPAAFWLTYPNNIIRHNHVAGGSHFGFWYRLLDNPSGPSYSPYICPKKVPLGIFYNNTAHSLGWFALWTFDEYYPSSTGHCSDMTLTPAVFEKLTAYHCTKGAEFVDAGSLQFKSFLLVNNHETGIEGKRNFVPISFQYDASKGPLITDSTIVGCDPHSPTCSQRGIVLPYSNGLRVRDTTFVHFSSSSSSALGITSISGICSDRCGGFTYRFSGIRWCDVSCKAYYRWEHEASFADEDGSVSGLVGSKIVPVNPSLNPLECTSAPEFSCGIVSGVACDVPWDFHRMAFNEAYPYSLFRKTVIMTTDYGSTDLTFREKDLTHGNGWFCMLQGGCRITELAFENVNFITNITFLAGYWHLDNNDCVIIKIVFLQAPDFFQILYGVTRNASDCPLTYDSNYNGDWCFDWDNNTLYYMVSNKDRVSERETALTTSAVDRSTRLHVYRCYYEHCIAPTPEPPQDTPLNQNSSYNQNTSYDNNGPHDQNGSCDRPSTAQYWSQNSTWPNGRPSAMDNLIIPYDMWLVLDIANPPAFLTITIYGTLELEYLPIAGSYLNIQLTATYIIIYGGHLIAGCPNTPINGQVTIQLTGDHKTPELVTPNGGPIIGAKAIGAFGGLDLHGMNRSVSWTRLERTAKAGETVVTLRERVDWVAGDEIVIATSVFSMRQNEKATVQSVSTDGKTLTLKAPLQFTHLGVIRNYGEYNVDYGAEVGLLTRNLRIVGATYSKIQKEAFGARVIVGTMFDGTQLWQGYARIENVEFIRAGQDGFVDDYDARFALTYIDTGAVTNRFPSYCRRNAFHDGFNSAIGAFGSTTGLAVEQNVVFWTVGAGIVIAASQIIVDRNLVMSSMFSGTYNGRNEVDNALLMGSIEVYKGEKITLTENAVAGSQRSGYRIKGIPVGSSLVWEKNVAHSVLLGVDIMPASIGTGPTTWITGFTIYKAWYYGIYSQCGFNTKVSNVVLAENSLGLMVFVLFPNILQHNTEPRWSIFEDSLVVGRDREVFGCNDTADLSDPSVTTSKNLESWKTDAGGRIGISFTSFMSGSNMAPESSLQNIMTYNGLYGKMTVSGVTFANFETSCNGICDTVITPSIGNDDGQHPVYMANLRLFNVSQSCIVYYFRPNIGLINSADCVDMDCDGKKKNLIKDTDGTFLGVAGASVIPQAQFEWNGDRRRGLGDYRIPKALLTDTNGNRIPVDQIAPYKGIVGNRECTFVNDWLAYNCTAGRDYEMLIIESMDPDTETRRLSPVAIVADQYIDLVNGPQDHGWCNGYTCRRRVSTFMALVSNGDHHAIYFSSTSPRTLRLHYINTLDSQCITLEVYYSISNRIDIYVNDVYVPPLNTYISGGTLKYNSPTAQCMTCPNAGCSNCPSVTSPIGSNFQNRWTQLIYVTMCGPTPVEIRVTDLVLISFEFPAMSVDEFFGANLVRNLAAFLGVPLQKVRIVNIVSEAGSTSAAGRRRRAITSGSIVMQIEIGDAAPVASLNSTEASSMSYDQLIIAYQQIIDAVHTGQLAGQLNVTFTKVYLAAPLPSTNTSEWANVVAALDQTASSSSGAAAVAVLIPAQLSLVIAPSPTGATSGMALPTQPALQLLTSDGQLVTVFGSIVWTVTSTLSCTTGSSVSLSGTTTINIIQGWANFTDLAVMAADPACTLTFCVSNPSFYCSIIKSTSPAFAVATPTGTSAMSTSVVLMTAATTTNGEQSVPGAASETPFFQMSTSGASMTSATTTNDAQHGPGATSETLFSQVSSSVTFMTSATTINDVQRVSGATSETPFSQNMTSATTTNDVQRAPGAASETLPVWVVAIIVVGAAGALAALVATVVVLAKKAKLARKVGVLDTGGAEVCGSYAAIEDSLPADTSMPEAEEY